MLLNSHTTGVNCGDLVKMVLAGFPHCKVASLWLFPIFQVVSAVYRS